MSAVTGVVLVAGSLLGVGALCFQRQPTDNNMVVFVEECHVHTSGDVIKTYPTSGDVINTYTISGDAINTVISSSTVSEKDDNELNNFQNGKETEKLSSGTTLTKEEKLPML